MGIVRYLDKCRPVDKEDFVMLHSEVLLIEMRMIQDFFFKRYNAQRLYQPHFTMLLSHMKTRSPMFYVERMLARQRVNLLQEFRDYEANYSGNYFFNRYVLTRPANIPHIRDDDDDDASTILGSVDME